MAGAEWLLAQNPEIGFPIAEGSAVWFLPMSPIEGAQSPKPTGQLLKGGNRGQKLALHHTGIREARIVVALLPSAKTTPAKVFPLSGW